MVNASYVAKYILQLIICVEALKSASQACSIINRDIKSISVTVSTVTIKTLSSVFKFFLESVCFVFLDFS